MTVAAAAIVSLIVIIYDYRSHSHPVLVSISVFMALSTVFHSINSPPILCLLTLFFPSYLCLIGPFNYISFMKVYLVLI